MKKGFAIIIIFICQVTILHGQNAFLEWADGMGGSGADIGRSIITDNSGNVYVTGSFQDTVDFNSGAGITNLISNGGPDIFLQKLDSNGNLLWAKSIGGLGIDFGLSLIVDNSGDIYLTGSFEDTVNFNPSGVANYLISNGNYDIFVSKFDTSGTLLWAKSIGGNLFDMGRSISVGYSSVYITGSFEDTVDFDSGIGVTNLTSAGADDIFVLKLDISSGNFIWAKSMGGAGNDWGLSLTNVSGEVFVTGFFEGSANFEVYNLLSNGGKDAFMLKIDYFGSIEFVQQIGSINDDGGNAITLDPSNNIIITGHYDTEAFVLKYNSLGAYDWYSTVDEGIDEGKSLVTDAAGNIFVTGKSKGVVGFDDIFIQKLDANGNKIWSRIIGDNCEDAGYSIALDPSTTNIYVTGSFVSTVDFDPDVGVTRISSAGFDDIFVLKLGQCTSSTSLLNVTVCDSYTSPSGNYTWTTTGVYTDVVQGPAPYCSNVITIVLLVDNAINTSVSNYSPTLVSDDVGATYQWIDCSTMLPIVGDTNQSFTASVNGSYAVVLTKNGCVDTSLCIDILNVGLIENMLGSSINIHPNPVSNQLTIASNYKINTIKIIDLAGRLVKIPILNTNTIDVSDLPKGIYFIQLNGENNSVTKKFVKN